MNRRKVFKWTMLVFNSIIISFVIYVIMNYVDIRERYIVHKKIITKPRLSWRHFRDDYLNQLGFRGRKIEYSDNDYVIILVGDSQVEATTQDPENMPERLLERSINKKNVKVFSVGASGYGADQEYIAVDEYFKAGYRADLAILWFTQQNDIWNTTFPSHGQGGSLKPTYRLDNGRLIGPDYYATISELEKYLPAPYRLLDYDQGKRYNKVIEKYPFSEYENYENDMNHAAVWLEQESDRMLYGCKLVNMLLTKMQQEINSNGGKFVSFYVEYEGFAQDEYWYIKPLGKAMRLTDAAYKRNVARCMDGIKSFPIRIETKDRHVSADDLHLNLKGNTEAMQKLADYLFENGYVKR